MNQFAQLALSNGVPLDTLVLVLILPIIVTLIAFFRQVVGIKAFGIYTPAIITFAFLATNQIKYGIIIFATVIVMGTFVRFLLKQIRLLYLPRVAIMITIVGFSILVLLIVGGIYNRTGLASVSIFPILIMITLVEKFVAVQIEKGARTAVILAIETLAISVIGYYIASWPTLISVVLIYPWISLLTIPVNIFLGKWTGLRLTEYFRFRQILKSK
ncbi:MAG TPA: 7TM domain-containing protein [Candidatus Bathyarchaeia archaeon]|nr:7TM domain-containing protein [Candidatus Bathyarchaeia archaeon]